MGDSRRRQTARGFSGAIFLLLVIIASAHADSVSVVTTPAGLSADDAIVWSQLGGDATVLSANPSFTSTHGLTGSISLTGPGSLVAVVCPETPCSWFLGSSSGFTANDRLIWTADNGNSGNGPLVLTFASNVKAVGAFIQADLPGQFTAQIEAFNGGTSLGTFPLTSDSIGDATFIGVI